LLNDAGPVWECHVPLDGLGIGRYRFASRKGNRREARSHVVLRRRFVSGLGSEECSRRATFPGRAEELDLQSQAGLALPAEGHLRRPVPSLRECRFNPFVLRRVAFNQGNAQAEVHIGRADVGRAIGTGVEDEKARNESADQNGVTSCKTEVAQQVGSLAEDRLGHVGVVSTDVLSVTRQ
jgi:hypothetical protein